MSNANPNSSSSRSTLDVLMFWGCFISLIATAFGFIVRALIIDDLGAQFGLDETQKGQIFGVGLWPFAISIVLFSLVVDKIGYGKAMVFAFICHVVSVPMTIFATGYDMLYWATFIVALGNGTVEAVINPVVATMFSKEKTKWLNILHAGWPGGLVLGGIIVIMMGDIHWQYKVGLILIPTIGYGLILLFVTMLKNHSFPVSEQVQAGVSYKAMLQECGAIGALIIVTMIVLQLGLVLGFPMIASIAIIVVLVGAFAAYTQSLGRPMFIFLLIIMAPLAITELGTDSWITDLMKKPMEELGVNAGWILVYTSAIMMILRFCAGPIVHSLSPLGLLTTSAAIASVGLVFLSQSTGIMILVAATFYGLGKTFFWPTMLGVVSEQFPKGGALTLNIMGGMGMLSAGIIGTALTGSLQDNQVNTELEAKDAKIHELVMTGERPSLFGTYISVNQNKLDELVENGTLTEEDKQTVADLENQAKRDALMKTCVFPIFMFVCYMILIFYFKSKGGYQAEVLTEHAADDERFTGGVEGPVE